MVLQVLVCGGGNAAHVLASLLGSRPDQYRCFVLTMFDHEAERWAEVLGDKGDISIERDTGEVTHGRPLEITNQPEKAVPGSDVIILSVPSTAHELYLENIRPHIDPNRHVILGAMPCRGGFDWSARNILAEKMANVTLFGTVTLPWACRVEHWGDLVSVLGTKREMDMVVTPKEKHDEVVAILQGILGKYPVLHDNGHVSFLSLSMLNFWHPAIMYAQFHDWDTKTPFDEKPLFYTGITDEGAQLLHEISEEVQETRRVLEKQYPGLSLEYARPTEEWFVNAYKDKIVESGSFGAMIRSNKAYQGLTHPMKEVDGKYVPDFKHRYMSEDLPNGIVVIKGIAEVAGIETPATDKVIEWCQRMTGSVYLENSKLTGPAVATSRCPQRYGFNNSDDLMKANHYV